MGTDAWLIAAGGFVGAICRYGSGVWAKRRYSGKLPIGTLFVNLTGAFLLGLLYGGQWGNALWMLLGTGFMGAYTTFSTLNWETLQLLDNHCPRRIAFGYLGITYAAGIVLALLGDQAGVAWRG